MRPIDLRHLGQPNVICCWQVDDVLVDPGPESCVETLLDALGDEQPRALLLTHIHFDHAGAAGALVREWPDVEVWVHERGARHLVDPTRLVASAKRLYGDDFDRLWGEVVAVPERSLRVLRGGECSDGFDVAYTPGHASHHVSYRHNDSGWVFPGDTCGVRLASGRPAARADAAAGHRPRRVERVARRDRGLGSAAAGDHALRRLRRCRRAHRAPARGADDMGRARAHDRSRRLRRGVAGRLRRGAGPQERGVVRPGDAAGRPVARARPLLGASCRGWPNPLTRPILGP